MSMAVQKQVSGSSEVIAPPTPMRSTASNTDMLPLAPRAVTTRQFASALVLSGARSAEFCRRG